MERLTAGLAYLLLNSRFDWIYYRATRTCPECWNQWGFHYAGCPHTKH